MKKLQISLPGVFILEPSVFGDARGFFLESYNERTMAEFGISEHFVQDNISALDLRQSSPTFGKWEAVRLSGENKRMLRIPEGLAHGFNVMSESAHLLTKLPTSTLPNLNARSRGTTPI